MIKLLNSFTSINLLFIIAIVACTTTKTIEHIPNDFKVDIPLKGILLEIDNLGFIYIVTNNNILVKYNQEGKKLYEYDVKNISSIEIVDVSNPHKILVFFRDYQIIKFLDNTLSEIGEYRFSSEDNEVTHVCMSNDNNLWIYDSYDGKIKKITLKGQILISTQPIPDITGSIFNLDFLKEENTQILIYDNISDYLVFNQYGHLEAKFKLPNLDISDIKKDKLLLISKTAFISQSTPNNHELTYQKKVKYDLEFDPISIRFYKDQWYILSPKGIVIKPQKKTKLSDIQE